MPPAAGRQTASVNQADPFGEQSPLLGHRPLQLLGARICFHSNSPALLRLVDIAYAGLPAHHLAAAAPALRISLLLGSRRAIRRGVAEPAPLTLMCGAGMLGGSANPSNFVVLSPRELAAFVFVSPQMLRFPYHTRYELIEFAVFTLAARSQGLVSLHAACVGKDGRGVLLMGPSGAGKSTVALQCLFGGFDFVAEDSVFVEPATMLATGVANFLHVRSDCLRWLESARDSAAIRKSPIIRRRSGVRKFEVDLRRAGHKLAASPLKIVAIVFLSQRSAGSAPLLKSMSRARLLTALRDGQAYAARQLQWAVFKRNLPAVAAYELRRGQHPREAVGALRQLLDRKGTCV